MKLTFPLRRKSHTKQLRAFFLGPFNVLEVEKAVTNEELGDAHKLNSGKSFETFAAFELGGKLGPQNLEFQGVEIVVRRNVYTGWCGKGIEGDRIPAWGAATLTRAAEPEFSYGEDVVLTVRVAEIGFLFRFIFSLIFKLTVSTLFS